LISAETDRKRREFYEEDSQDKPLLKYETDRKRREFYEEDSQDKPLLKYKIHHNKD
jgi:hypothetical protein